MKNRALKYTIGFAAIGIVIILLVSYTQRKTLGTFQRNLPYVSLVSYVKNKATTGSLLLEKILAGDTSLNFDKDVIPHFTTSQQILQSAYNGGTTTIGQFEKSNDEETKVRLKKALHATEKLTEAVKERWTTKSVTPIVVPQLEDTTTLLVDSISTDSTAMDSTALDSAAVITQEPIVVNSTVPMDDAESLANFKTAYKNFEVAMNNLALHINKSVQSDTNVLKTLAWLTAITVIIIFIILGVLLYRVLYRNVKRIKESEQRLTTQANAVEQLSGFIDAVSAGDYNVALALEGENGDLTNKLITMRDKLKENAENERKRGWSTMGLAQIGEILRVTSNVSELYDNIIKFIVKYTRSNQGGLFIINEQEDDKTEVYLELVACYAYERKKFLTKKILPGEGQVGLCFQEGQRVYLLDVPEQYIHITSGLGSKKPNALLLIPMKINGEVYGVIELATFAKYEDFEIELIEKLAESIASTISTVRVNESTRILLEKTQQQAEEMKSQEEEIHQNIEELEATQEEMRRKQTMLESELKQSLEQIDSLKSKEDKLLESQYTFQAIIDNMPRAIAWKDKDLRYIGCNKIFLENAGFASLQDIVGKTDFEMPWKAKADEYRIEELEILRKGQPKLDKKEVNVKINGEEVHVYITKMPVLNDQKEVVSLLVVSEEIIKN
jgi:PAS domain-containing protein